MAKSAVQSPTPPRVVELLMRVLKDRGEVDLRAQAAALNLPVSTAYRLALQLQQAGLISRIGNGSFTIGFELRQLAEKTPCMQLLADIARPHIRALAQRLKLTAHLGFIEEDMVTYAVKEHGGGPVLFTRSGTQLEAYCSAIGKVLLAALPDDQLEQYLSNGPFIPLTSHTIAEPAALRQLLQQVRVQEFGIDAEEVLENLRCLAVPVRDRHGQVVCAISVSRQLDQPTRVTDGRILKAMRQCAANITARL